MTVPITIAAARPETLPAAIAFLVRNRPDSARAAADLQSLFDSEQLFVQDLLLATHENTIHGAMLSERLGGAQASLGLPETDEVLIARQLIEASVANLQRSGQRVLHVLASVNNHEAHFDALGFTETTDLIYLSRTLEMSDTHDVPSKLTLRPADADDLAFAELIAETFEDSLDLPELIGLFDPSEVLENFQRTITSDPPLWWYAEYHGFPCGVLLLSMLESQEHFELTYMGLIPTARRRGLGGELARIALKMAASHGGTRIELSRDARNHSAGQLYDQLNFVETHRRSVRLRIFPRSKRL